MSKDKTSENLNKFLDSEDPAMVRMGLSMAKGTGVVITIKDLERFLNTALFSDDIETIKTGIMLANEAGVGDEALNILCSRSEINGNADEIAWMGDVLAEYGEKAVKPVLNTMRNPYCEISGEFTGEYWEIGGLVSILSRLSGQRALSELIEMLDDECSRLLQWNYEHNFPNDNNGFYHKDIMTGIENTWIQSEENIEHLRRSFINIWNEDNFCDLLSTMKDMRKGCTGEAWVPYFFPLEAAKILTEKGWKPNTDEEKIDYWAVVFASEYWEEETVMGLGNISEWGEEAIDPLIVRIDDGITFVSKALTKLTEKLVETDGKRAVKKNILELLNITDFTENYWDHEVREQSEYEKVKKGANLLKQILE